MQSKQYADSISRSYYAVLDAARILLILNQIFPKVMPELSRNSIKSRTEADYSFEISFTKEEAEDRLQSAKLFVEKVIEYIYQSNNKK